MAAAVGFFAVKQQGAKANIDPDVRINDQRIAVFNTIGNVIRQVAAVQEVEVYFKVLIGRTGNPEGTYQR